MKKYTNYFISCMVVAIIALILSGLLIYADFPALSAASFCLAFVSWYAGVMAPAHEKYVGHCTVIKEHFIYAKIPVTSCCKVGPIKGSDTNCPKCNSIILEYGALSKNK